MILSPLHDCRLTDLVHGVVERLEAKLVGWQHVRYSAWSHRDSGTPHVHLIVKTPELSARDFAKVERTIQEAAPDAYQAVRNRQREYARERDRGRGRGMSR